MPIFFSKMTIFRTVYGVSSQNPDNEIAKNRLRTWLYQIQTDSQYDSVFLLDSRGVKQMSVPASVEPVAPHLLQNASEVLRSGKVSFLDFHRDGAGSTYSSLNFSPRFR